MKNRKLTAVRAHSFLVFDLDGREVCEIIQEDDLVKSIEYFPERKQLIVIKTKPRRMTLYELKERNMDDRTWFSKKAHYYSNPWTLEAL